MTPRDLFTSILRDIGVLGAVDRMSATDGADALSRANDWIDMLALESMTVYYIRRDVQNLTANVASYTIGTGGAFNQPRPVQIERARLIIDKNAAAANITEIDLEVFTEQQWEDVPQKSLASPYVQGVRLDGSFTSGLGKVFVWPIPNIGTTQLVLHTRLALTEFPSLDVDVTYPPGYRQFIRTNLAKQFAGGWGKTLTEEQKDAAKDSRSLVKRSNIRPVEATIDPRTPGFTSGRGYDWRTG